MSHQRYIWNAFETILDGQVSASADVILLQSAQNLRSPGYLVIEPDVSEKREYISFTGIATNSLTGVVRGLSGGQAGVTHDSGKVVRAVVLHQFFDDLFTDIEALEATSAAHVGRSTGHPTAKRTAQGFMSGADKAKLDGIEASAKGDQTSAEILASLLGVDGSGSKLDADLLDGIEASGFTVIGHTRATGNAHGNASRGTAGFMSGADKTKLDGVATGATAGGGGGGTQSASDIRDLGFFTTSNDGSGSGLDADKVDGLHASSFSRTGHGHSATAHTHDSRYYTESEVRALIDQLYGADAAHNGKRIFIQSAQPSGRTNDLWIDTS